MKYIIAISIVLLVVACVVFAAVPDAPVLASPSDASKNHKTNVALIWNLVASVDSYAIKVGTVGDATDTYYTQASASTAKLLLFRAGEKYYWRVKARNADGWGAYAATQTFETAPWPDPAARHRGRH